MAVIYWTPINVCQRVWQNVFPTMKSFLWHATRSCLEPHRTLSLELNWTCAVDGIPGASSKPWTSPPFMSKRGLCVRLGQCREDVKVAAPVNFRAVALIWDTQGGQVIIFNTVWTFLFTVAVIFTCPVGVGKGLSLHTPDKQAKANNNLNDTFSTTTVWRLPMASVIK